jgi:hypothetical protein
LSTSKGDRNLPRPHPALGFGCAPRYRRASLGDSGDATLRVRELLPNTAQQGYGYIEFEIMHDTYAIGPLGSCDCWGVAVCWNGCIVSEYVKYLAWGRSKKRVGASIRTSLWKQNQCQSPTTNIVCISLRRWSSIPAFPVSVLGECHPGASDGGLSCRFILYKKCIWKLKETSHIHSFRIRSSLSDLEPYLLPLKSVESWCIPQQLLFLVDLCRGHSIVIVPLHLEPIYLQLKE